MIERRPQLIRKMLALALALEAVTLAALFAYWIYLRLWLSRSLGLATQILTVLGIATTAGAIAWVAWRIGRRYQFRFTIRTMMIAMAIFGLLLAVLAPQIQQSFELRLGWAMFNRAMQIIASHDGKVGAAYPSAESLKGSRWGPTPELSVIHEVSFSGQQFTYDEFKQLADHPNLQWIEFRNCDLPREGLLILAKLKSLRGLGFTDQQLTTDELQQLLDYSNLRYLSFRHCQLPDYALWPLVSIRTLKWISLRGQTIDENRLLEFRLFRPGVLIYR